MARAKRKSTVLETARQRLNGLKAITPAPNFGPNLQIPDYEQKMNALSDKLDRYNTLLSTADALLNEIEEDERELRTDNTRYLSATEAQYGPDSSQYEQVGGTRTSERKRGSRKGSGDGETAP